MLNPHRSEQLTAHRPRKLERNEVLVATREHAIQTNNLIPGRPLYSTMDVCYAIDGRTLRAKSIKFKQCAPIPKHD